MKITVNGPPVAIEIDKTLLRRVLRQASREVIKSAQGLIKAAGSGRKYGAHQASAPGQAPASLTGKLAASFSAKSKKGGLAITMTDNAFYALILEAGAEGGGGKKGSSNKRKKGLMETLTSRVLAPRPFLSTALDAVRETLPDRISNAVTAGVDLKGKANKTK